VEKAIIEWIKFFKFNMGLQLADKVTALDAFQATEGTAGHREAAESIYSPVQLSGSLCKCGQCTKLYIFIKKKKTIEIIGNILKQATNNIVINCHSLFFNLILSLTYYKFLWCSLNV